MLYIGVTRCLENRLRHHALPDGSHFADRYGLRMLVYMEMFERPMEAIRREKQLKKWNRKWKIELIEKQNKEWEDLSVYIPGAPLQAKRKSPLSRG